MLDPASIGRSFSPFHLTVERGKLREFLMAFDDDNPIYKSEDPPVPPTFSTVFTFWGGVALADLLKAIGVEIWNVLHGEQEYEYVAAIHIGDTITGQSRIANIYTKAGMDFVEIATDYHNQNGELVIKDHALMIVRG
jgi:N-terminal half of MaoC dehydratase